MVVIDVRATHHGIARVGRARIGVVAANQRVRARAVVTRVGRARVRVVARRRTYVPGIAAAAAATAVATAVARVVAAAGILRRRTCLGARGYETEREHGHPHHPGAYRPGVVTSS